MTTYQADQIRHFLETVDKHLRAPVRLVIIGGGAALLGHDHEPLNFDVLLHRYLDEMNHAIGRQADRDQTLVAGVEFIWDEATADRAQQMVDLHRAKAVR